MSERWNPGDKYMKNKGGVQIKSYKNKNATKIDILLCLHLPNLFDGAKRGDRNTVPTAGP